MSNDRTNRDNLILKHQKLRSIDGILPILFVQIKQFEQTKALSHFEFTILPPNFAIVISPCEE